MHLEGSPTAVLEIDTTGNNDWSDFCAAPCDRAVPPGSWYRIGGRGLVRSHAFTLQAAAGDRERILVEGAPKPWLVAGVLTLGAGAAAGFVGVELFDLYALTMGTGGPSLGKWGLGLMAVGAVLVIPGFVMVLLNQKTGVTQCTGTSPAPAGPQALQLLAPPSGQARAEQAYLPIPFDVPVVSMSF